MKIQKNFKETPKNKYPINKFSFNSNFENTQKAMIF